MTDITERGEHLGELTSEVLRELGAFSDFFDDPITRSSGCADELGPLQWAHIKRRCLDAIYAAGYSYTGFIDAIRDATDDKFVYFSGVAFLNDPTDDAYCLHLDRERRLEAGISTLMGACR